MRSDEEARKANADKLQKQIDELVHADKAGKSEADEEIPDEDTGDAGDTGGGVSLRDFISQKMNEDAPDADLGKPNETNAPQGSGASGAQEPA